MNFLLVLLMFMTASAFKPVLFRTKLICDLPVRPWCAMAYFWEADSSSEDDAVLFFKMCTNDRHMYIHLEVDRMGGDGGVFGYFQDTYEIAYAIIHTCSYDNKDHEMALCECVPSHGVKYLDYDRFNNNWRQKFLYLDTAMYAPSHSYTVWDSVCALPEQFANMDKHYETPPGLGCTNSDWWNVTAYTLDELHMWFPLDHDENDLPPKVHFFQMK